MQPTRILPDLQCSLLCEDVRQEVTGNFILIGVVNFIPVPQLPVTAARLLLVDSVRIVLRNGLQLLGISQPESM